MESQESQIDGKNCQSKSKHNVAIEVFKSLRYLLPEDLNDNFKKHQHEVSTRFNGSFVTLPKMCSETGQTSFIYAGALIFKRRVKTTRDETSSD